MIWCAVLCYSVMCCTTAFWSWICQAEDIQYRTTCNRKHIEWPARLDPSRDDYFISFFTFTPTIHHTISKQLDILHTLNHFLCFFLSFYLSFFPFFFLSFFLSFFLHCQQLNNRTKWKGWSPLEHRLFPQDLKHSVKVMLLCQNRVIHSTEREDVKELKSCYSGPYHAFSTSLLYLYLPALIHLTRIIQMWHNIMQSDSGYWLLSMFCRMISRILLPSYHIKTYTNTVSILPLFSLFSILFSSVLHCSVLT